MKRALMISAMLAFCLNGRGMAVAEENADDFMQIHQIEIVFHQAGTTKNLDLMLSLFTDDATITSQGKTYAGKEQIRSYWQAAGPIPATEPVGRLHSGVSHKIRRSRRWCAPLLRMPLCR